MNLSGINRLMLVLAMHLALSLEGVFENIHKGIGDIYEGVINYAMDIEGRTARPSNVKFYLRTSQNDNDYVIVYPFRLEKIADTEGEIFFFIHGWTENRTLSPWYEPLSKVLLVQYPKSHVVLVDWGEVSQQLYTYSAMSTESVGKIIANVIKKLINQYHVPLQRIILIGHSLGAQIAGWIGKKVREDTNYILNRIIALDPAKPIFNVAHKSKRLNEDDAKVVMVVHSDTAKFGYRLNCGTIDFFPNGGFDQPGCMHLNLSSLRLLVLTEPLFCSHRRSHDVFIEAVKYPQEFVATKCDSYDDYLNHQCDANEKVSMGNFLTQKTGSFFLKTTSKAPFY